MPLTSGTKIGPYEVASLLCIGGMGEVYRSRNSKLGREVALKVFPTSVAIDADRLTRFSREAKVLASLNHPNIASIYGLEDSPIRTVQTSQQVPSCSEVCMNERTLPSGDQELG